MGGWFSISDTIKKNHENMAKMHSKNLERQLEVQNQLVQKQMALQIAGSRETSHWIATFYVTVATIVITAYRRTNKKLFMAPLVPLSFMTAYFLDLGYGNKINRIRHIAEGILENESDTLNLPGGRATLPPFED